jgi:hypothetical protein
MDSIEAHTTSGITFWAEDMAQVFEQKKGYDVRPYLFLMSGYASQNSTTYMENTYNPMPGTYKLAGDNEALREGILNDILDVITELYMERMLIPMKEWLNSVGIETRAQISYGKPFELTEPGMAVDYPETENRVMYNQVDYFRYWTGGAKLENKVLSSETSGQNNTGYRFPIQYHLRDAYAQFAAGIQRTIWHVWSADYGFSPDTTWPGTQPGGLGYFKHGTRNPYSRDYDEFNAHLGRVQQLLQTGKARSDVGFIYNKWYQYLVNYGEGASRSSMSITPTQPANINRMNYQLAHQGVQYRSTELQDNGYTYDYFSPEFLFDDDVYFDPETKTIEGAGYRSLVLFQPELDIKGARKILEWAELGLPVVILDGAATRTPFNDGMDVELASVMNEM